MPKTALMLDGRSQFAAKPPHRRKAHELPRSTAIGVFPPWMSANCGPRPVADPTAVCTATLGEFADVLAERFHPTPLEGLGDRDHVPGRLVGRAVDVRKG